MNLNKIPNMSSDIQNGLDIDLGPLVGINGPMSLSTLKARANGYAAPNRFMIRFAPPTTLSKYYDSSKIEKIVGMARDVTLPNTRLGTFEHRDQGVVRKLPNDIIYTDVAASFYVDDEMLIRQFFQDWISTTTTSNNNSFNYLEEYSTNIQITQLSKSGHAIYTVELLDAYPVNLGEIQLSAESENQLMIQNVGFSYHTWREIDPITLDDYTIGGIMDSVVGGGLSKILTDSLGVTNNNTKRVTSMAEKFIR